MRITNIKQIDVKYDRTMFSKNNLKFSYNYEGVGEGLSSVIFNSFVKSNDNNLKESVSRLVIKALHTAKLFIATKLKEIVAKFKITNPSLMLLY
jgi:hypothetical protein